MTPEFAEVCTKLQWVKLNCTYDFKTRENLPHEKNSWIQVYSSIPDLKTWLATLEYSPNSPDIEIYVSKKNGEDEYWMQIPSDLSEREILEQFLRFVRLWKRRLSENDWE